MLETAGGDPQRLAQGVDLQAAPVWSPASDAVVVRRGAWAEGGGANVQLVRVQLNGSEITVASAAVDLYAVDFSPDGNWLYYAAVSANGTDLARTPASGDGAAQPVARLSDGFAMDWHLSPDGAQLSYLSQTTENANVAFVVRVLDLESRQVSGIQGGDSVAQFNPLWERDGVLTVGRIDGDGAPIGIAATDAGAGWQSAPLPRPTGGSGFDVPISWSPDGTHLAVRSFQGSSTAEPGPSFVAVLSVSGGRQLLSPLSDVMIAGWLTEGP